MESKREHILKHKKLYRVGILAFLIFITCFTFPMFNFVKVYSKTIVVVNLLLSLSVYYRIGAEEAALFEEFPVWKAMVLNLAVIGVGLLCRYLLEYGEVSNTYNFVPVNMACHIIMALGLSTFTYWRARISEEA